MRESATWKTMFCTLGIFTVITALAIADPPAVPPSTPEQLALLDKIQGVGSLKFGAALDSFDKDSLKSVDNPNVNPTPIAHYKYTPSETLTWGTLTPAGVELEFYYNQLIGIKLHFNETNATFIPVSKAVLEKYGSTRWGGSVQLSGYVTNDGHSWTSPDIYLAVCLPEAVPAQAPDNFLEQKVDGAVEVVASGLRNKLTHDKQEAMRTELLKGQNLDKIKSDL